MTRSKMGFSQCASLWGIAVLFVSMAGCARLNRIDGRLDDTDTRLDTLDEKMATLNHDITVYNAADRKRAEDHALAIRQVEDRLTSQLETYDRDGKKRFDGYDSTLRKLDHDLVSHRETSEQARKRQSQDHETAMRQLEERLTVQMASQWEKSNEEKAALRNQLDAIQVKLVRMTEEAAVQDAKGQLALANLQKVSKEDIRRVTEELRERYNGTHQVLETIGQASTQSLNLSVDVRSAIQRLIAAHQVFVDGNRALVKKLEAETNNGQSKSPETVLGILYEQRKAQIRLLNEMQTLLAQALPAVDDSKTQ